MKSCTLYVTLLIKYIYLGIFTGAAKPFNKVGIDVKL